MSKKLQATLFVAGIIAYVLANFGAALTTGLYPLLGADLLATVTLAGYVAVYAGGMLALALVLRRRSAHLPAHALLVATVGALILGVTFMAISMALQNILGGWVISVLTLAGFGAIYNVAWWIAVSYPNLLSSPPAAQD
jgi:predicted MFS family arabinose efflux permease